MPDQGPTELQFFLLIHPGATPLFNLIEPNPMKSSDIVEIYIRLLHMCDIASLVMCGAEH